MKQIRMCKTYCDLSAVNLNVLLRILLTFLNELINKLVKIFLKLLKAEEKHL